MKFESAGPFVRKKYCLFAMGCLKWTFLCPLQLPDKLCCWQTRTDKRILDFKIKNISDQLGKASFMFLTYHSTKVLLESAGGPNSVLLL